MLPELGFLTVSAGARAAHTVMVIGSVIAFPLLLSACGASSGQPPASGASDELRPTTTDARATPTVVNPSSFPPAPSGPVTLTTDCNAAQVDLTVAGSKPGEYSACVKVGATLTVRLNRPVGGQWDPFVVDDRTAMAVVGRQVRSTGEVDATLKALQPGQWQITSQTSQPEGSNIGAPSRSWLLTIRVVP